MIDMNDEKQKYFYLNKCVSGKPIDFYGEKIYQPIVDDVFEMGEDNYYKLISPFISGRSLYNAPDDMSLYECIMNNKEMLINFIMSINYFLKIDNVRIYERKSLSKKLGRQVNQIILNDKLIIDNNKFEELKQIILLICNVREVSKEDVGEGSNFEGLSDETRRRKEKLLKGRARNKKNQNDEKKVKLVNVYNFMAHCQDRIDYKTPLTWTMYQLYDSYQLQHIKENIKFLYDVASNGMLGKDKQLEQFSDKITK